MPTLTIAICTKDRPESLTAVLTHLSAFREIASGTIDVLVIDDGDLSVYEPRLAEAIGPGAVLRIHGKPAAAGPGLYASRSVAVREARGEWVLFLDDDAFPEPGYLSTLLDLAGSDPSVVGYGGVDVAGLPISPGYLLKSYAMIFGLMGKGPGHLGRSGYNHSQMLWRDADAPFRSEFLHGCNMAFERKALEGLPNLEWLTGHACCEDLVLSHHASTQGALIVNPGLRVRHIQAEGGRGNARGRLASTILNHARFQRLRGKFSAMGHAWALLGLLGKDLALSAKRDLSKTAILSVYASALPRVLSSR